MRPPRRIPAVSHPTALAVLLLAFLLAAWRLEPAFVAATTQLELATQVVETALLCVPMTLILLIGGIDLSVGSTMALAAVALGMTFEATGSAWWGAGAALLVGLGAGAINGACVGALRIHPLIVTLATLSLFRGIAEGISLARPISGFPESFTGASRSTLLGINLPGWTFIVLWVVAWIVLRATPTGRRIYAVGAGEEAARFSGLPVARVKMALYAFSGACAGLAAAMFVARRNTAKADIGLGVELDVITAVVLGGTSVFGGRGGLGGTVLGLLLLHEVRQFVSWRWNNDELIFIVVGALLIGSMLAQRLWAPRGDHACLQSSTP
ncbi:MAG: ABC transporter permease [Phycisphaerales bacterium]|nr:ABC transporter permease [Phycisphaerales bacterium]